MNSKVLHSKKKTYFLDTSICRTINFKSGFTHSQTTKSGESIILIDHESFLPELHKFLVYHFFPDDNKVETPPSPAITSIKRTKFDVQLLSHHINRNSVVLVKASTENFFVIVLLLWK